MKILDRLEEIQGMIAKSNISDNEFECINRRINIIKKEFDISLGVTMTEIKDVVGTYFGLDSDYYLSRNRHRKLVVARQMAMCFMLKHTVKNQLKIGAYFGRTHATVIHARKTISNQKETDRKLRSDYDEIETIIQLKYFEDK